MISVRQLANILRSLPKDMQGCAVEVPFKFMTVEGYTGRADKMVVAVAFGDGEVLLLDKDSLKNFEDGVGFSESCTLVETTTAGNIATVDANANPRVSASGVGCTCPECGQIVPNSRGVPCYQLRCNACGVPLRRGSG